MSRNRGFENQIWQGRLNIKYKIRNIIKIIKFQNNSSKSKKLKVRTRHKNKEHEIKQGNQTKNIIEEIKQGRTRKKSRKY